MEFESIREAIVSNNNKKVQELISANPTVVERSDEDGWSLLHYAAKHGNLEAITLLLSKGANFNVTTTNRNKPIHTAAEYGHAKVIEFFVDTKKMNVDDRGKDNLTPLHYAAKKGELEMVKFLVGKNATIDALADGAWTPLHYASEENKYSVVEFLVESGADISKKNPDGKTSLQLAEGERHQTIKEFLKTKESEKERLQQNKALLDAAKKGNSKKVQECLEKGEIDYKDQNGWTALHHASNRTVDDFEFVKFLVDKNSDINSRSADNNKPLHIAARNGHENIVKFFLDEKRLSVNDPGKDNWTPLHYAAESNRVDVVRYLVEKKEANINAKNYGNETPFDLIKDKDYEKVKEILLGKALIDAVKQNDITEVENLIQRKAKVSYLYESNKWIPLHYAASLGYKASAEELIKKDSSVINAKDHERNTPLHIAADQGHKNIVEFLLEKGANIDAINSGNKTPLQLAREKDHQATAQLLLSRALLNSIEEGNINKIKKCLEEGAEINHEDNNGWAPLHYAANKKTEAQELVRLLVERGANANSTTNDGDKPLHIASSHAHTKVVKFFIDEKGLDINDQGKDNWTPLHHAVNKGSSDLVKFLIKKEADIYAENSDSVTPLELAQQLSQGESNRQEVKTMLQGKALIDAIRKNDISRVRKYIQGADNLSYSYEKSAWQPLHYAASLGYKTLATELINKDSNVVNAKDSDGNTPLHLAAAHGKGDVVELFLSKQANIDEAGKNNWTPLHYAVYENQLPIVKFLIEKGANIDATGLSGETPLQLAVEKGDSHKEVAKLLRSRELFNAVRGDNLSDDINKIKGLFVNEVDIDYSDLNNWTPLHYAARNGYTRVAEFLVEKKANVNARTDSREKPLHIAAKNGHKDIVEFFIDQQGLSVNEQGENKWTPLHYAAASNSLNVVQYLIEEKEATIDSKDRNNWTALHHASKEGHIEIVKFLIKKGANINAHNSQGKLPVDLASEPEVIQFLLNEGLSGAVKQNKVSEVRDYLNKEVRGIRVNIDYRDQNGRIFLHHAARHGYSDVVELLVQSWPAVDTTDLKKWTPLHYASEGGHLKIVRFLTRERADINIRNSDEDKPLHVAAKSGHQPIVRFFIDERGMDINDLGRDNWTPLHYASANNHSQTVNFLVKEGADITIQNAQGKAPLELITGNQEIARSLQNEALFDAVEQGEYAQVQRYLDNGADPNSLSGNGWTLLHRAAEKGHLLIVSLLVERGASIDAENSDGDKPLHIASQYGHINIVKLLLNGKVNDKGKDNKTPLHYAAESNHFEVVRSTMFFEFSLITTLVYNFAFLFN